SRPPSRGKQREELRRMREFAFHGGSCGSDTESPYYNNRRPPERGESSCDRRAIRLEAGNQAAGRRFWLTIIREPVAIGDDRAGLCPKTHEPEVQAKEKRIIRRSFAC